MGRKRKTTRKWPLVDYILITICSVLIIVSGIITRQMIIKIIPALISLVVTLFIAKANRYGFLLGSMNCMLYAIGYMIERLYASVVYIIIFGGILQLITFINWCKNANKKKKVNLRKMNLLYWVICCLVLVAIYVLAHVYNLWLGGSFIIFDSLILATGVMFTLLSMLRFVEAQIFNCLNNVVYLLMWIVISIYNLSDITYVLNRIRYLKRLFSLI